MTVYVAKNHSPPVYHRDKDCCALNDADVKEYDDDDPITEWKDECKRCNDWTPDEETKRSYGNGLARKIRMQHNDGEKA